MPREQVGAGAERERAAPVGSPRVQTPWVLPASCSPRGRRPASGGRPNRQGPGLAPQRDRGLGGGGVCSPGPVPARLPVLPGVSTHVSLHERPHEATVHGSSGRARQRSAPRRPAQRAHGPRPECGRAPRSRSQPGRAGWCGGRPRPLSAHAPPGPRRPARRWLLAVVASRPGCRRWGATAGSAETGAGPAAVQLPSSALGAALCHSPPGSSARRPAQPCLRPPVRALTSRARVSMRPAAPAPARTTRPPCVCTRAGALPPRLARFPAPGAREKDRSRGAEGGGRQVGATPCCFRLRGGSGELCPAATVCPCGSPLRPGYRAPVALGPET